MKKGSRPALDCLRCSGIHIGLKQRPDEEGIKTLHEREDCSGAHGLKQRPDEEGIRPGLSTCNPEIPVGLKQRPDEEGIKTGRLC